MLSLFSVENRQLPLRNFVENMHLTQLKTKPKITEHDAPSTLDYPIPPNLASSFTKTIPKHPLPSENSSFSE